jgi:hypothetical protein
MTMIPPTKLGARSAPRRFDQRVLSGRDHLTADRQQDEAQAELRGAEQEQLQQIDVPISDVEANGQTRSGQSSADMHAAGNIGVSRCWRIINIIIAMQSAMLNPSVSPNRWPSVSEPPTMMITPIMATRLAARVVHISLTPNQCHPKPVVMNGCYNAGTTDRP